MNSQKTKYAGFVGQREVSSRGIVCVKQKMYRTNPNKKMAGKKINVYRNELGALYGMPVDDPSAPAFPLKPITPEDVGVPANGREKSEDPFEGDDRYGEEWRAEVSKLSKEEIIEGWASTGNMLARLQCEKMKGFPDATYAPSTKQEAEEFLDNLGSEQLRLIATYEMYEDMERHLHKPFTELYIGQMDKEEQDLISHYCAAKIAVLGNHSSIMDLLNKKAGAKA